MVLDLSGGIDLVRGMSGGIFYSLQAFSVRVHLGPLMPRQLDAISIWSLIGMSA